MTVNWTKASLSYWEKNVFYRPFDVAIIGSGIIGLSAAIELKNQRPGWRICILDRWLLPLGAASTRNAGFACLGSPTELLADIEAHGLDHCREILTMRWEGLNILRERLGEEQLRWEERGGYEIFLREDRKSELAVTQNLELLNNLLEKITGRQSHFTLDNAFAGQSGMNRVNQTVAIRAEALIHPGYMIEGLMSLAQSAGVTFLPGVDCTGWEVQNDVYQLQTEAGPTLAASRILIATNGFTKKILPNLEVSPARNTVMVTSPIPGLKLRGCFHYKEGYVYFRSLGTDRVLIGGGRHLANEMEAVEDFGTNEIIVDYLKDFLRDVVIPGVDFDIEHQWSGILGVGPEKAPIMDEIEPGVFVSVRMGGMGIAIGSFVAKKVTEMILLRD